ncbi:DNase I-like protein [Amylostereum chailletii]|nr:DNase I-like protein [Amylostereum chailletii]
MSASALCALALLAASASALQPSDIQGPAFLSPFAGHTVENVTGIVSAKSSTGFWILGSPSDDPHLSPGLRVFTSNATLLASLSPGDAVSLAGRVSEFRASNAPSDLLATELTSPANLTVLSAGNALTPILLGRDRSPPTEAFSALDRGPDGWLSVPNNASSVDAVNATLEPAKYGLDFWESLEGALVTVPRPVALNFENGFGEVWVRGDWEVTGLNSRGGLSLTIGADNLPDGNPETVIIGSPLDGTSNPGVAVGTGLSDITGVVVFQFGFFYILPLTAPTVLSTPDPHIPTTSITSDEGDCAVRFGDYNVENLAPTSAHMNTIAAHVATFLSNPDFLFLQEIQDDSGPTSDGTVSANLTLDTLVAAIASANGGAVRYSWAQVDPVDGQDGGQPGGNIRPAYLYNPAKLTLVPGAPAGGPLDATTVTKTANGSLALSFNPGRIDPTNAAWTSSRKPVVAHWQTASGQTFFTVDHHGTSKGGSTSLQGNPRPPVNLGVDQRTLQVETIAAFIQSILDLDPEAAVLLAGDFNEFAQARSVFAPLEGVVLDADVLAGIPPAERYTYMFGQSAEQLDHVFVSPAVAGRGRVEVEHVHVNNWAASLGGRTSDHDPSVGRVWVC